MAVVAVGAFKQSPSGVLDIIREKFDRHHDGIVVPHVEVPRFQVNIAVNVCMY